MSNTTTPQSAPPRQPISRRIWLWFVTVVISAVVVGCGSTSSEGASAPEPPASEITEPTAAGEEPAAAEAPELNDRGNIVKKLGEEAWIPGPDGEPVITFVVDSITPGVKCTDDYASPSENGHLTAVQLRVATKAGGTQEDLGYLTVSAYDFSFIGSDGLTFSSVDTVATYSCLDPSVLFPQDLLNPGSKYVGTILLDLPEPSGTLVYAPQQLGVDNGWEWNF